MEPISPELVLVDPDLARIARARLEASAAIATLRAVAREVTVLEPVQGPIDWLRGRAVFALLSLSVAVNAALAVLVISGDTASARPRVALAKPARMHRVDAASVIRVRKTSARPRARRDVPRRAHHRLRSAARPAAKATLPSGLIDARTGLPKSNLQILCRRQAGAPYHCVLRIGASGASPRVVVRYRFHRRGRAAAPLRDLGVR